MYPCSEHASLNACFCLVQTGKAVELPVYNLVQLGMDLKDVLQKDQCKGHMHTVGQTAPVGRRRQRHLYTNTKEHGKVLFLYMKLCC